MTDKPEQPLSSRVRPNVEAAPWVVDSIAQLEARIAELKKAWDQYGGHMPCCDFNGDCSCGFDAVDADLTRKA